jgi:cytochrome c
MTTQRSRASQKCHLIVVALIGTCIGGGFASGIRAAIAQSSTQEAAAQDDGKSLFAQCSACHALTPSRNGRGPTLYHLFGRKAGAVPGYAYSLSMKNAGIVWRENTLTQFILNPQRVVPGTTMTFTVSANSQQMKALIDYLRSVTR